ncbi:relaxase [Nitratireductor sp. CAU 1489]|uniref:Relaxase n=1 Tax=Nitratireductor arenosus TaxID=2682096 RepID=A0A844QJ15_9HYPH|nr:relaxase [Nitratireductor arenosus]MVA97960.1 relaxase [Nitratireductor arenosus]
MILKGSKRGGAWDLGRHLLKAENEHVEVHEIRGFVADRVIDALKEAEAISKGTRCRKFLFSLALNPPETEEVPVSVFENAVASIEKKLGLVDQPRVILFHEKEGRRHAHCVWSRIDAESMTAIDLPHFKLKLMDVSRQLYRDHDWRMPDGMIDPALRSPLSFDRKEWFQAKRAGTDPRVVKEAFQQCWAASDSGKAFRSAMEQRGYYLARGDRRGVVALDLDGQVYAVARWVGIRSKDVVNRMGNDATPLPSVTEAREQIKGLVSQKLSAFEREISEDFARAAQQLEAERLVMVERHRAERRKLQTLHDERWNREAKARSDRFRRGLRGLWDRITGQHARLREQNEAEVADAKVRDNNEKQALIERQLRERRRLQQEIKKERMRHTKEVTRLRHDEPGKHSRRRVRSICPERRRSIEP